MKKIDFSQRISAAQKASQQATELEERAKAECQRRIYSVCDEIAQMNLAAACAANLLSVEQFETYQLGLAWIRDMRLSWQDVVANAGDPAEDANWPEVPIDVRELASAY